MKKNKVWKKVLWILAGIGTLLIGVLVVLFAVKEEKRKITGLKAQAVVGRTKKKLTELKIKRAQLDLMGDAAADKSIEITKQIKKKDEEITQLKVKVKELDDDKVAAEFNRLYFSE